MFITTQDAQWQKELTEHLKKGETIQLHDSNQLLLIQSVHRFVCTVAMDWNYTAAVTGPGTLEFRPRV